MTATTSKKFIAKTARKAVMLSLMLGGAAVAAPASASDWGMHAPHVQAESMHVDVNRTHVLKLPRPAAAVVVGNPAIADIAVHTTDTILVLGRNFGSTNVIAFDSAGGILSETRIEVGETPSDTRLRVYQGAAIRQTYNCHGECVPAPSVGDNPSFRAANVNAAQVPVTDSVVSRAGTDFGGVAGRPFSSSPVPAPAPAPAGFAPSSPASAPATIPSVPSGPLGGSPFAGGAPAGPQVSAPRAPSRSASASPSSPMTLPPSD